MPENILVRMSGMPCWSPDGKTIAFHSNGLLYTADLTLGEYRNIFGIENKKILPYCWTKNGKNIYAAVLDTVTRKYDIWSIPVDGSRAEQLTFFEGVQTKPSLSPDDSFFVFASNHGGDFDLWIQAASGGNPVQITFFPADDNNPGFDVEASWSPVDNRIAFTSTRTGYWAIWLLEPDMKYISKKIRSD